MLVLIAVHDGGKLVVVYPSGPIVGMAPTLGSEDADDKGGEEDCAPITGVRRAIAKKDLLRR